MDVCSPAYIKEVQGSINRRVTQKIPQGRRGTLASLCALCGKPTNHSLIVTFSILTSEAGRSPLSVFAVAMALTTSCPSVTRPKIV